MPKKMRRKNYTVARRRGSSHKQMGLGFFGNLIKGIQRFAKKHKLISRGAKVLGSFAASKGYGGRRRRGRGTSRGGSLKRAGAGTRRAGGRRKKKAVRKRRPRRTKRRFP